MFFARTFTRNPFWDRNPITSYTQIKNIHTQNSPREVMLQIYNRQIGFLMLSMRIGSQTQWFWTADFPPTDGRSRQYIYSFMGSYVSYIAINIHVTCIWELFIHSFIFVALLSINRKGHKGSGTARTLVRLHLASTLERFLHMSDDSFKQCVDK